MSTIVCGTPQYLVNLDKVWYGAPGKSGFRSPIIVDNKVFREMSQGDKIERCFLPQDVVVLNVPGEYLQVNNTIVSLTPLINALNPITGSGVPTQSPTGYGSKSNVYYDLTGKITYVWNGSQWIPMCGCSGTGTTPTTPVTPTCAISVSPTSVLNSSLRQGDPVNISVNVSGTVATATATISSGVLPTGLSVSYLANGTSGTVVISGTPSAAGSFTCTLKVGVTGCEASIPVAMTVAAANNTTPTTPTTPTQNCNLDAGGDWAYVTTPNTAVSTQRNLTGKIPTTATLTKLSGNLPSGISLNWAYPTLTLSGTATAVSQGQFAVYRFTDSATGCTKDFQVRVDVQAVSCTLSVSPNILNIVATQGTAIPTQTVSLTNAPTGAATLLESGALPSGLSLALVAGQITVTGTPTAVGTFTANYYVGTVDCWRILTVNVTVNAAQASCTIASSKAAISDATLQVGVPMTPQQFTLTGIPVGYETTAIGTFPPGLSITPQVLSNTSILFTVSGTPTTAGTYHSRARVGTASCATEVAFGFVVSTPTSVPTPTPTPTTPVTPTTPTTPTGGECNIVATPVTTNITSTVGTPVSF